MGWALVGGLFFWSFGLYIDPVEAHFGWSRAEVSLGIAVAILAGGLAAPVVGRMTDRRGPRFVLFSGAVIGALGFGLLATTSALWQWYIYLGVVGVAMAMLIFIPLPVLAARWFERRRGAAVGILGVGISIGGLVIVPIVRVTIDALGWEGSLIVSAVAIPAYWLPVTFFIVRDRPPEGVRPDASAAHPATDTAARADLSLRQALRTPLFWALAGGIALYFFSSFGLVVHSVPLFESRGVGAAWAAALVSFMAGLSLLTRLLLAWLADRVHRFETVAMIVTGSGILGSLVLLFDASASTLALFVLLWALADSGTSLIEPPGAHARVRRPALCYHPRRGQRASHGMHAHVARARRRDFRRDRFLQWGAPHVRRDIWRLSVPILLGDPPAAACGARKLDRTSQRPPSGTGTT